MSDPLPYEAVLAGRNHRIPPVCPSCLEPAEVEQRYGRASLFPLWQKARPGVIEPPFLYCVPCGKALDSYLAHNMRIVLFPLLGFALGMWPFGMLIMDDPLLGGVLGVITMVMVPVALTRLSRYLCRKRHPRLPGWGPPVIRPGDSSVAGGGVDRDGNTTYHCARVEWRDALVNANAPGAR